MSITRGGKGDGGVCAGNPKCNRKKEDWVYWALDQVKKEQQKTGGRGKRCFRELKRKRLIPEGGLNISGRGETYRKQHA